MGSTQWTFPAKDSDGNLVDITGSTIHLWLAVPQANNPVPVLPTHLTPGGGFAISTSTVRVSITEADLNSWALNPGTYTGQILVTDDGGTTTDLLWQGTMTVNAGWITTTF